MFGGRLGRVFVGILLPLMDEVSARVACLRPSPLQVLTGTHRHLQALRNSPRRTPSTADVLLSQAATGGPHGDSSTSVFISKPPILITACTHSATGGVSHPGWKCHLLPPPAHPPTILTRPPTLPHLLPSAPNQRHLSSKALSCLGKHSLLIRDQAGGGMLHAHGIGHSAFRSPTLCLN